MAAMAIGACSKAAKDEGEKMTYPETKKIEVVDDYFGTKVSDPYRWLEDDRSPETEAWVKKQNEFTSAYLSKIGIRSKIKSRLEELWDYEKLSAPFEEGGVKYFYKNDGLQNHSVLYAQKGEAAPEVFLDPNKFSADGTTSLASINFSDDGKLAAYAISEGGSDWRKVIVINAENKEIIGDTLVDVKFSGISWKGNEGFYYSSYDKPEGSELSAKTDQHKVYYHKLGTPQKDDKVIFGADPNMKRRYCGAYVSDDQRFLFISAANSTTGNELYMMDLTKPDSKLVAIINNFDSDTDVIETKGSKLYISTNLNAPNNRIVTVDASNPTPENWKDFIPETENVLSTTTGSGFFFAIYMKDAISQVLQYDYDGNLVREVSLPGVGSVGGFGGKDTQETLYYSFTDYKTPGSTFAYNAKTGESTVYWKPEIKFDSDKYESKQILLCFTAMVGLVRASHHVSV
jgi:prolyl oligopeptidase